MGTLDSSIVNIALQSIARSLQVPSAAAVWVTTAFLLMSAAAIPAAAALSDRVGRRASFPIWVGARVHPDSVPQNILLVAALGAGASTLAAAVKHRRLRTGHAERD